ncbi:hypothetical protein [Sphingopyxis sp. 550A]
MDSRFRLAGHDDLLRDGAQVGPRETAIVIPQLAAGLIGERAQAIRCDGGTDTLDVRKCAVGIAPRLIPNGL